MLLDYRGALWLSVSLAGFGLVLSLLLEAKGRCKGKSKMQHSDVLDSVLYIYIDTGSISSGERSFSLGMYRIVF